MKNILILGLCLSFGIASSMADDWPQWLGPKRDGVWRETGILEKFPETGLKTKWRTPIGAGYAGPAVQDGKVFVMDRQQTVANPANPFQRGVIPGTERVLCLDAQNGTILWKHEYDCPYTVSYPAGPRATPLVDDGLVYTLGTEGHLFCLNAKDGKEVWSLDFKKAYGIPTPVWGFSASPVVEGEQLICLAGGDGSTVVSFNKKTGKEIWRALSAKEPGYCPPEVLEGPAGRQLIVWTPEHVNGLNLSDGKVLWTHPFAVQQGLSIATPRLVGDMLFLSAFYQGPLMLQLDKVNTAPVVLWKGKKSSERDTSGLHSLMATPFIQDGYIYGVCTYGQFRCVNAKTGERVWETFAPTTGKEVRWGNAFIIKNGDRFFLPNEQGELVLARLSPKGYEEISRAKLLEPTNKAAGRDVVWSHPAFANKHIYARNDREIVAVDLASRFFPNGGKNRD